MKPVLLASILTLSSAAGAQAASYLTAPVALDPSSELLVAVANTCKTPATYSIEVKHAINGKTLRQKQGTLAVRRGTTLSFSFGVEREVYQKITFDCQDGSQRRPLINFTVRDLDTKVPRFVGGTDEGTGI